MSIQLNTDGMIHEFEKCVRTNLQNIISQVCEGENLNYVEIVEKTLTLLGRSNNLPNASDPYSKIPKSENPQKSRNPNMRTPC